MYTHEQFVWENYYLAYDWYLLLSVEEAILRDTDRTEQAIANLDAPGIVGNTSSIARRAHRILQVAQSEADNSEDPLFVDRVSDAVDRLRNSMYKPFSLPQPWTVRLKTFF